MGLLAVASHRAGSCLLPHFNQHVNLNKKIVIVVPEEPVNLEIVVLVSLVKTVHGLVTWIWLVTGLFKIWSTRSLVGICPLKLLRL